MVARDCQGLYDAKKPPPLVQKVFAPNISSACSAEAWATGMPWLGTLPQAMANG